jgi:hypothetical protein
MILSQKQHYAKGVGPGGLGCPCCNPYGCHPRNMKHYVRRVLRRKNKQALKVHMAE